MKKRSILYWMCLVSISLIWTGSSLAQEKEKILFASTIIDSEIYDDESKYVGEVDNLIINRKGKIERFIIEYCDTKCDTLVSLPFDNFKISDEGIALEGEKKRISRRPEFNYYDEGFHPEYFYRSRSMAEPKYPQPRTYYWRNLLDPPTRGYYGDQWVYAPAQYLASVALNRPLMDKDGSRIGTVKDFIFDRGSKEIEKIIVSSIESLEEGIEIALPYKQLGFTSYGVIYDDVPENLSNYIYKKTEE
ncbi:MAG: PRC-barrel domain-containing protein [Syntrophales bacterium]|jgi:sporulation protein YlmC with PRC-barrel domain|nr:PRC-barrel domain-containing protein [Syntrophales bacterium]MDY0044658.1 PRC-barrel domain-containing protein [Syntrophales bacterium]